MFCGVELNFCASYHALYIALAADCSSGMSIGGVGTTCQPLSLTFIGVGAAQVATAVLNLALHKAEIPSASVKR